MPGHENDLADEEDLEADAQGSGSYYFMNQFMINTIDFRK